jgi:hypothetical protein
MLEFPQAGGIAVAGSTSQEWESSRPGKIDLDVVRELTVH